MAACRLVSGGGFDLLNGDQGDDFLDGGAPNPRNARGKKRDRCAGGSGRDTATHCEFVYRDVEVVIRRR